MGLRLENERTRRLFLAAVLAVFVLLATLAALTYAPRADEGFFASPAVNLATKGFMGTTVLEGRHAFMKDIHRYTYWITPLDFIIQAGWYKLVGFSLTKMRMLSMLFGLLGLGAWFVIVERLSGRRGLAALTVTLIALDFNYIVGASSGRMDIMAAALGFSGIAAYLVLRERNYPAALLAGNALAAAAGLTHPVAGYLSFFGQMFLILYFDRKRLTVRTLAFAAAPYLVGGAAWGWYILKDPDAFRAQFGTNATMGGRLNLLTAPWAAAVMEIKWRYLKSYGLVPGTAGHFAFLKGLALALYVCGLAGAILTREIRNHKGWRALMLLLGIYFLALTVFDGQKAYYYLPHVLPFYAALTVAWLDSLVRRGVPASAPAAVVACVVLVEAGGVLYRAHLDPYERTYVPAIAFLIQHAPPPDLVFGNANLGFGYGFDKNLVDDVRIGYYTGRKPDWVVLDDEYLRVMQNYRLHEPKFYDFISRRLATEYEPAYTGSGYRILVSRERVARGELGPLDGSVKR